jgi:hypothetical protein
MQLAVGGPRTAVARADLERQLLHIPWKNARVNLSLTNRGKSPAGVLGRKTWSAMNGKTAWRFSAMAFDASRDERCPRVVGPLFFQFGVALFWVALAVEGRAHEAWRELKTQNAGVRRSRLASVWANCAQDLRDALLKSRAYPAVTAWSLPDSRRMRQLGLGCMWAVLCPYCSEFHTHSPGEGRRTAHCCAHHEGRHYVVEFDGVLPLELQSRFYDSSKADLPRLVQQWAEADGRDTQPATLQAA